MLGIAAAAARSREKLRAALGRRQKFPRYAVMMRGKLRAMASMLMIIDADARCQYARDIIIRARERDDFSR